MYIYIYITTTMERMLGVRMHAGVRQGIARDPLVRGTIYI